ncbi:MAG TPA: putative Ig domain-containing protein [Chthoniobacterales bacterium]|jgi:hypothetical protein|nr:putative Ig domain-containing protein [Chthoniobacterales bacterium]
MNKTRIFSSLLIGLTTVALASSGFAATPKTWAESYGVGAYDSAGKPGTAGQSSSGADVPREMAQMPDGGFVVVGQVKFPRLQTEGNTEGCVVRFAADGAILWQRDLHQLNDRSDRGAPGFVYNVKTDASGNIFIAGGKGNVDNGGQVPFVAKFSPAGDLVWQNGLPKTTGKAEYFGLRDYEAGAAPVGFMSLTNDGGVLLPLYQQRPNSAYATYGLAKFNGDGSLAFYKVIEGPQQYPSVGPAVQSRDGSRYVMAIAYPVTTNPQVGAVNGTMLLVYDAGGNLIAQHGFPSLVENEGETPVSLVTTADGGFASLSIRGAAGTGLMLRKFNADASAASLARLINVTPNSNGSYAALIGSSLAQTADGGFLIGGHTSVYGTADDNMLMKVSAVGALEFVSLLGGPKGEGDYSANIREGTGFAIPASDGGYAFTIATRSYNTGVLAEQPDWWVGKTDANRKIRNFAGRMIDHTLSSFTLSGSSQAATEFTAFKDPDYTYAAVTSPGPQFAVLDPGTFEAPYQPNLQIQASGPRIISAPTAEAIINQHFGVQVVAAFFDEGKTLTYSATGLPAGFAIDPNTGIIYGVARPGSETTTPFLIEVQATDGTETATGTLRLTISAGAPVFRVNGADKPTGEAVIDKPLQFTADYAGRLAGQKVTLQASTDGSAWNDLATGLAGFMTFDASQDRYVLNTTSYPQESAVRFRVRVVVPSRADVFSNEVGPFNLASSKGRAGQTVFRVVRNGLRADYDFRATQISPAPGVALRVQASYSPGTEGSWVDITNTSGSDASGMKSDDAMHFSLAMNNIKAASGVYFRAVGAANGYVDSLSNIVGPYNLIAATPPQVTIVTPTNGADPANPAGLDQNADGTAVVSISVRATANTYPIKTLSVAFDGNIIGTYNNAPSGELYTVNYQTDRSGDHVIEAIAFDDHGVAGRAATAQYIRIGPPIATSPEAASAADRTANDVAVRHELFTVAKSGGDWDDSSTWKDSRGNPGIPGAADFVAIGSSSVVLHSAAVYAMSINGGRIIGPGQLQINNMLTINGGSFDSFVNLTIKAGAVCQLNNAGDVKVDGLLQNRGTMNVHGARGLTGISDFLNTGTVTFQKVLLSSEQIAANLPLGLRAIEATNINLSGKVGQSFVGPAVKLLTPNSTPLIAPTSGRLVSNPGGALISPGGAGILGENASGLISNDGGGILGENSSGVISNDGGSLISHDGGSVISNDGGSLISHDGGSLISNDGGGFKIASPTGRASRNAQAASSSTGLVISGGEVDLTGIVLEGPVTIDAGVLSGSGIVAGNLTNNGGFISPGHSPGTLTVLGNFQQAANGTLVMEVLGAEPGRFDRLQVRGTAALGGALEFRTINGYVPLPDDPFNPVSYASVTGTFAKVSSNIQFAVNPTGVIAILDPNKPNPKTGQPLNIATRMGVQAGDNVLIAGFIVSGPSGSTKKVLIRGIGPSLAQFGLAGTLSDPLLELHKSDGTVTNDNWQQGDTTQIPNGFAPGDSRESAIVVTLTPGSYSAVLKGAHGETGVGIAEVYDLDPASPAQLANIATRGFINTGDDVMIGGFIVGGTTPAKILVRVVGPTLTDFGVPGALADPTLELHDSNGSTISNDDWRETQETEIIATTIPPTKNAEPAIVATLVPGNYTAVVRGKNNTTGVGLVEAYNLQ